MTIKEKMKEIAQLTEGLKRIINKNSSEDIFTSIWKSAKTPEELGEKLNALKMQESPQVESEETDDTGDYDYFRERADEQRYEAWRESGLTTN